MNGLLIVIELLGQLLAQRDQAIAALRQRVAELEAAATPAPEPPVSA